MSFHETSTNLWLKDGHILVGECEDGAGGVCHSELDLDQYIGNDHGKFEWGGENFSHSAKNISFSIEGAASQPILRAELEDTEGGCHARDINLAEFIENCKGQLRSKI